MAGLAAQLRKFITDKNYERAVASLPEERAHKEREAHNVGMYERKIHPLEYQSQQHRGEDPNRGMYEDTPQTIPYYRDHSYLKNDALSQRRVSYEDIKNADQGKRNLDRFADASIVNLLGDEIAFNSMKQDPRFAQNLGPAYVEKPLYPTPIMTGAGPAMNIPVQGSDGVVRNQPYVPIQPATQKTPIINIPSATAQVPLNMPVKDVKPPGVLLEPIAPMGIAKAAVVNTGAMRNPYGGTHPLSANPSIPERGLPQTTPQYVPDHNPVPNLHSYQYPSDLMTGNSKSHHRGAYDAANDPRNKHYLQRTL